MAFFNDSWKATQNLTVEFGVRYEAHFMPAAYNLNMVSFWPDRYQGVGTLAGSGIVQGGVTPGVPNDVVFGNWTRFWSAPRDRLQVGYKTGDPDRRGHLLRFPNRTNCAADLLQSSDFCQYHGQLRAGRTKLQPEGSRTTGLLWTRDTARQTFRSRLSRPIKSSSPAIQPHGKTDQVIQDNFTIQRELPRAHLLLETGYIGTKGTHLMATQYINPLIPQSDGTLVRRYPGFGIITMTLQDGDSTYHSWQTTLKRRYGQFDLPACLHGFEDSW